MSDYDIRFMPHLRMGMPKEAMTDLYRAKYGLPLDGETHERFIATKVPYRKNKDYRPRFRNYSFGYPTYKKDNYMRHWYNFLDIIHTDATVIRLAKIFASSYLIGTFYSFLGGLKWMINPEADLLDKHKVQTSSNYVKQTMLGEGLKALYTQTKKPAATFAIGSTFYFFLVQKFKDWDYSRAQAYLRASIIVSPIIVFFWNDRPFTNFWYRSALVAFYLYTMAYTFAVSKTWKISGSDQRSTNSEKFYLKSVSPQEIAKIEYEDHIQKYGKMFDLMNVSNYYEQAYSQHGDKWTVLSSS